MNAGWSFENFQLNSDDWKQARARDAFVMKSLPQKNHTFVTQFNFLFKNMVSILFGCHTDATRW